MATLNLLTSGAQAASGNGAAVDTSAMTVLRPVINISTDMGKDVDVEVAIQMAPAAAGPWRDVIVRRFNQALPPSAPNYSPPSGSYPTGPLTPDAWARVRWSATAGRNTADGAPGLTLGVGGTNL